MSRLSFVVVFTVIFVVIGQLIQHLGNGGAMTVSVSIGVGVFLSMLAEETIERGWF